MSEASSFTVCGSCGVKSSLTSCFRPLPKGGFGAVCPACHREEETKSAHRWVHSVIVILFIGTFFAWLSPSDSEGWVILNIGLVIALTGLLALPHEFGHLLAGKLVGLAPYMVVVGSGRRIASFELWGAFVDIHFLPYGGLTFGDVGEGAFLRIRHIVFSAGGLAVHAVLIAIAVWLDHFLQVAEGFNKEAAPLKMFVLANAILLVANLFPHKAKVGGQELPSDGARILSLLFARCGLEQENRIATDVHRIYCISAHGDSERAMELADMMLQREPSLPDELRIMLSAAMLDSGNYRGGMSVLQQIVSNTEDMSPVKAVAYNNTAWALLMLREHKGAEEIRSLSRQSSELMPWEASAVSTYGSAEAIYGDALLAVEALTSERVQTNPEKTKASSMAALSIAYKRLGKIEESNASFREAERIDGNCEMLKIAREWIQKV